MKLYRHWVERTCEIAGTTFRFRDGSNVSAAEAEAKIDRRVELLRRTFGRSLTEGESEAVREAMKYIGGRTPEGEYEAAIREEVLEEPEPRNAITRNYYGAEVLNSEDTCFVDVDCVRRPGRGFRAVGRVVPFLVCLAATIAVLRLADRGALQEGPALLLSLAAVFATIVVTAVSIVRAFRSTPSSGTNTNPAAGPKRRCSRKSVRSRRSPRGGTSRCASTGRPPDSAFSCRRMASHRADPASGPSPGRWTPTASTWTSAESRAAGGRGSRQSPSAPA
jgi:hypothetical protein